MINTTRGALEFGLYRLENGPDRLVTKEELREQVWGATHVSDTRLRVTVSEVRAALGDDQDSPAYLETVPGRGYRFVATNQTTALDDTR